MSADAVSDSDWEGIVGMLSELDDINIEEVSKVETPALDQLLRWSISGDRVVVTAAVAPVVALSELVPQLVPLGVSDLFDGAGDGELLAVHGEMFVTETQRCVGVALELLTGGIPLGACFDAAKGFQQLRLALLRATHDRSEEVVMLAAICSALGDDMIALALS